jgi:hypothetical protein
MFFDANGVNRKVAELCGHASEPESVTFVDASWVANPAFVGAVKRNNIYPSATIMSKIEAAFKKIGYEPKEGDFLKAAACMTILAKDDPTEPPADEPVAEEPVAPEADPEVAPEGSPAPEPLPEDFGDEKSGIRDLKDGLKEKILKQISDEIVDDMSKEEEESPRELETLDESIIKPASDTLKVWSLKEKERKAYHKIGSHLASLLKREAITNDDFEKLRYGTYLILASGNPLILSKYGFYKNDFAAMLSYLDSRTQMPLSIDIKKTLVKMGGLSGKKPSEALLSIVASIGRKITRGEGKKALTWLNLMDSYNP